MKLPTYEASEKKQATGKEVNPVERFVLEHEPVIAALFRKELQELIDYIAKGTKK